jgi:hypothetical protein
MAATGEVTVQKFTTNEVTSRFSLLGAGTATDVSLPPGIPSESPLFPAAMRITYEFAPILEPSAWLLVASGITVLVALKIHVVPNVNN